MCSTCLKQNNISCIDEKFHVYKTESHSSAWNQEYLEDTDVKVIHQEHNLKPLT